ncbi:YceI family protein [Acinetobacter baumannii]
MHLKTLSFGLAVALAKYSYISCNQWTIKLIQHIQLLFFVESTSGFSTPSANFSDIQGVIKVDNTKPANSSVNVTIPLSSVNTNVPAFR